MLYPRKKFRKKLALLLLKKYFNSLNNFLEIGAGRGDFSKTLSKDVKNGEIIEFSDEAVAVLKKKLKKIKIISGNILTHNFDKKYSLIAMFEVLEHIKDDEQILKKINNLLKKDGIFIFSVPSRMKNWSMVDKIAGHYRRYEKKDLIKKLKKNNYKILHFYSYGFPIINLTSMIMKAMFRLNIKDYGKDEIKENLSKKSGLGYVQYLKYKKITNLFVKILFSNLFINIYILLSMPFNKLDLGDGYICLVKKNKPVD